MGLTPMMQQYLEIKEKNKECILFFRLGDFYEMFFEDAEVASKELELVLTGRDCGLDKRAPMCGIPYHAANSYINRLVNRGFKVAICEQLEDPSVAKGIVKRDVTKIITPGTFIDSNFLEDAKNNYIMSLFIEGSLASLCFADISTGDFQCTSFDFNISLIMDEISKFNPKEIILQKNISINLLHSIDERFHVTKTTKEDDFFTYDNQENLKKQFKNINIDIIDSIVLRCCGGLLNYIVETQKMVLNHLDNFDYYNVVDYLCIDINSRRNLEISETLRDKSKKGSLLGVLDKTNTAMGGRLLRKWVKQPLISLTKIQNRLDAVEEVSSNISLYDELKTCLREVYDIERLVGKISSKNVNAKEILSLKYSLSKIPYIKEILSNFNSTLLKETYTRLDCLEDVYEVLHKSISENPSVTLKEGDIIKDGYNDTIDELRVAKLHGKEWIASLEQREREVTGIKSLKVGYNKVFGYYIEVTKTNLNMVPINRYIRKQTLANCERYITPELKEIEDKILGAQEKLIELEYNIFVEIREWVEKHVDRMKLTAKLIAQVDCLSSLAIVALENNYCKPEIKENGEICILEGRHPVVEKVIPRNTFVANDTFISSYNNQLMLITGPNMAGKSTYMRQVALITLMAQMGSFVPAKSASINLCDKIFTRIGASDDLARGKSTFMVEMWEVAHILNNATGNSLILLDEVGRGTSTYDGLSIAWAVIEFICKNEKLKCKTLFATHYHELTSLEGKIPGVKNYSIAVKKVDNDIIFLRKIIEGGADESYGIEVAKLAGIPEEVIVRSKEILESLENKDNKTTMNSVKIESNKESKKRKEEFSALKEVAITNYSNTSKQIGFTDIEKESLIKEIASLDILSMNPMEGFNKLYEIINKAKIL